MPNDPSAHKAHWGLLLARTDWDQPKHRGADGLRSWALRTVDIQQMVPGFFYSIKKEGTPASFRLNTTKVAYNLRFRVKRLAI